MCSSPQIARIAVVLPAPSGPISPNISPRLTLNDTPRKRLDLAVTLDDVLEIDRGRHLVSAISASTGMPCLSTPSLLSTLMRTR